ncbi:hypothetical protein Droror1_Dr00016100, partial [Drosera rotundifolia]
MAWFDRLKRRSEDVLLRGSSRAGFFMISSLILLRLTTTTSSHLRIVNPSSPLHHLLSLSSRPDRT